MTLILELTPQQQQRLHEEAAREGLDTQEYALKRLLGDAPATETKPEPDVTEQRARQIAAAKALRGKYAHIPGSVDEFLARKREEREREERRWRS